MDLLVVTNYNSLLLVQYCIIINKKIITVLLMFENGGDKVLLRLSAGIVKRARTAHVQYVSQFVSLYHMICC